MVLKNIYSIAFFSLLILHSCGGGDKRIDETATSVDTSNSLTTNDTSKVGESAKVALSSSKLKSLDNGEVIHLTEEEFLIAVFDFKTNKEWKFAGNTPAIIDFYADWCGPCKKLSPVLEKIAKKYAGKVHVFKVDIDKEQTIASVFGVQSIPALLYCGVGKQPLASQGLMSEQEIEQYIAQIIK